MKDFYKSDNLYPKMNKAQKVQNLIVFQQFRIKHTIEINAFLEKYV